MQLFGLSTVVYAERGDEVLLLRRAGGAMTGQWFLPGGAVERDEPPESAARRELFEESGLRIAGELELVGAYPIWVYGGDCLQLSYRGQVVDDEVTLSDEHTDARWIDPTTWRSRLTDDVIDAVAGDNKRVRQLVKGVQTDLDTYLSRVGRISG